MHGLNIHEEVLVLSISPILCDRKELWFLQSYWKISLQEHYLGQVVQCGTLLLPAAPTFNELEDESLD